MSIAAYTEYRARESIKDMGEAIKMQRKSQEQQARLQARHKPKQIKKHSLRQNSNHAQNAITQT
jgi:Sec-independent protein translocase protein TatA